MQLQLALTLQSNTKTVDIREDMQDDLVSKHKIYESSKLHLYTLRAELKKCV